jgi:hypothetical protein
MMMHGLADPKFKKQPSLWYQEVNTSNIRKTLAHYMFPWFHKMLKPK